MKIASRITLLLFCFNSVGIYCTAQTAPSPASSGKYTKLVWSEEFDYSGLPDTGKWNYETGYVRNKEMQFYTKARQENAFVRDGNLVITALNDSMQSGGKLYPVTSASLITLGKQDWTYGRIEVRAKIPSSLGTWPAIWTLASNRKIGWPAGGEIDMMEHVGYMPDTLHFNVHTEKYNHVKKTNKGVQVPYKAPYNDFHVFAIEWFEDHIDWWLDDKKVFTFLKEEGKAAWPFDEPQYLILNLAFGGAWGGSKGVNLASLPQKMLVDYVRVFQ